MKEQLVEAWRTNNKIGLLFIELIADEGMHRTLSTRGGRTVYQQLVHLHNVRLQWLQVVDKQIGGTYKSIEKEASYDRDSLYDAFENSGKGIEEFINRSCDKGGKVNSFKKGLIPFVSYLIAHEAHHRGNILLTLKQSGVKIADELKRDIWEWNRI